MNRFGLILFMLFSMQSVATDLSETTFVNHKGQAAERQLKHRFMRAGVHYPPARIQLITLKQSRRVELWAWQGRQWRHVHDYPVFAASGHTGPKLKEGDRQVPEGFYQIESLNPNSNFHLSLKLNYPNSFDWINAVAEERPNPGSNIFIHGSAWSAGCLAIGNRAIEELYVLAERVGINSMHVIIAPYDFRKVEMSVAEHQPDWISELYAYLNARLNQFPLAAKLRPCYVDCLDDLNHLTLKHGGKVPPEM